MKQYHYLYRTTNLINNKIYIGVHSTDNLTDGYMGSGTAIKNAIKKYGRINFSKDILEWYDWRCEALLRESIIVTSEFIKHPTVYNEFIGGENGAYGYKHDDKSREKMSISHKGLLLGFKHSDIGKSNMSNARKELYKDKTKHPLYGKTRVFSSIWKQHISDAKRGTMCGSDNPWFGKHHSLESIEIIKHKRALQVLSPEHINALKTSRLGVKLSDETKRKVGKANSMKCVIDGIIYDSLIGASKVMKISDTTLGRRLKSDKYPTWNYLDT